MEKKKISVFVAGQKLTLITTESEKYVSTIASKVDTAINSLFASSNMSREKCAVMTALDFCDDEAKARASLNELKEQIKDYIKDSEKLREENEALKAEVEKLKGEKQELLNSKKTLIATSVEIKKTTEKTEEVEIEIDSDDDLSFDFDEDEDLVETNEVEITEETKEEVKADTVPATDNVETEKKPDKKRHSHEHKNPFKERFLKQQSEQKGYTPLRQYSLFDDETDE
ncbi:MAG: cell division protein ZapA [Ruminococcus sp.]|nr:cell division protein ZapA [Ruminococcus sp.]